MWLFRTVIDCGCLDSLRTESITAESKQNEKNPIEIDIFALFLDLSAAKETIMFCIRFFSQSIEKNPENLIK